MDRIKVQVVGGLIEHQQLRLQEQRLSGHEDRSFFAFKMTSAVIVSSMFICIFVKFMLNFGRTPRSSTLARLILMRQPPENWTTGLIA